MSDDLLTRRLRQELSEPSQDSRARIRRAVRGGLGDGRRPRHWSRIAGGVLEAGVIAGACVMLVLAVPRGTGPAQRTGTIDPGFAVLRQGAPFDLTATGLTATKLWFPGVQVGSLRLARTLPVGTHVVVGRASNQYVCLFLIPPRARFRSGTCAPSRDVGVAALTQFAWWGHRQTVLLVADGVRVESPAGRRYPLINNTVVLANNVRQVLAIGPDGTRRELRLSQGNPVPMRPADAARFRPVVPDLTGLSPDAVATLLSAARLADGRVQTQEVAGTAPNSIIGQSVQPGQAAAQHTEIGLVLAAPTGPGGHRIALPGDLMLRWAPIPRANRAAVFADSTSAELTGAVRVLIFPANRAQAASAQRVIQDTATTIVAHADETSARRLLTRFIYNTSLIADPTNALADAVGVTHRPATAVLDRSGRVAYRADGVPARSGSGGPKDLAATLAVLHQESFPAGTSPSPPAGVWYLHGRSPLPVAQVPTVLLRTNSCPARPDRVWAFGPTHDGWRAWVALTTEAGPTDGVQLVFVVTHGRPIGSRASGTIGCGVGFGYAASIRRQPVVPLATWTSGAQGTSLWVVRDGYTQATTQDGRTWSVANGLLAIRQHGTVKRLTLSGPAGTRVYNAVR